MESSCAKGGHILHISSCEGLTKLPEVAIGLPPYSLQYNYQTLILQKKMGHFFLDQEKKVSFPRA